MNLNQNKFKKLGKGTDIQQIATLDNINKKIRSSFGMSDKRVSKELNDLKEVVQMKFKRRRSNSKNLN